MHIVKKLICFCLIIIFYISCNEAKNEFGKVKKVRFVDNIIFFHYNGSVQSVMGISDGNIVNNFYHFAEIRDITRYINFKASELAEFGTILFDNSFYNKYNDSLNTPYIVVVHNFTRLSF